MIEVWESQEQLDHYNRTVVWPLSERLFGGGEMPTPTVEEFDVRGLVVPTGGVFV
ncbi:MAG: hypothetical protein JWP61_433 [Friedmanniella sp.]|nr:hypothetical protein [Friedmanniella sp.]